MRIFATEQLGPKQSLTPEGYLLCEAVPIARTGTQLYAGYELDELEAGIDGLITVVREESEVFSPETMASFEGKSITVGHAFVDPDSWSALTKGTVQNVRRGDGIEADTDLLVADLLITDAGTIGLVREELDDKGRPLPNQVTIREVSCGYDANYVQDRPGVAFQRNIIGNHVALVERGRAGPRCSIQDEDITPMTKKASSSLMQRMLLAIRSKDAALQARVADEAEEEMEAEKKKAADEEAEAERKETKDAIADLKKTVDAMAALLTAKTKDDMGPNAGDASKAGKVADEENDDDKDKKKSEDEEPEEKKKTADAMRDTASRAEILVPGFRMPTADSVPNLEGVIAVQRKVLGEAIKTADGEKLIAPLMLGKTVTSMTSDAVSTVFHAASELARIQNNAHTGRVSFQTKDSAAGKPVTAAEINARNAEFWAKQGNH